MGIRPVDVTLYNATSTWHAGYNQWVYNRHMPLPQLTPIANLTGSSYVDWGCEALCVRLHEDGTIELRDGWQLDHPLRRDTGRQQQIQDAVSAAAQATAYVLAQQQVIQTLTQGGARVLADRQTPAGRVVQFQIGGLS